MKVIGITGGIASGKTTVARMFANHGLDHLDADLLVHEMMRDDKEMIVAIAKVFPSSLESGQISRRALSDIVTRNPDALPTLEAIIHPRVIAAESRAIAEARASNKKGVILDIPLLFETGGDKRCDTVVVVHAPQAIARARAFSRPGMTEEKWRRLVGRQLSEQERCARADHVITTDGSEDDARRQVEALLDQWKLR